MFSMSAFFSYEYYDFLALLLIRHCHYGSQEIYLKGHYKEQHQGGSWKYSNEFHNFLLHPTTYRERVRHYLVEGEWSILNNSFQNRSWGLKSLHQCPKVTVTKDCMQVFDFSMCKHC